MAAHFLLQTLILIRNTRKIYFKTFERIINTNIDTAKYYTTTHLIVIKVVCGRIMTMGDIQLQNKLLTYKLDNGKC